MKIKLLKTITMLSKWFLYIFSIHFMFFNFAAASGNSQQLSVNDIFIEVEMTNASVTDVFRAIEAQSQFKFAYEEKDLGKDVLFTFTGKKQSIADLLRSVGEKSSLKFRRVNDKIDVARSSVQSTKIEEVFPERAITGTVTDELGEGLPGVTVMLKGTTIGTITAMDGSYSLTIPDETVVDGVLVFSFVGYLTEELPINGRSQVDIQLKVDVQQLQEVVVIGYQSVKKQDLTGSTAIVDVSRSEQVTATSVAESIQGLAAGVTVRNGGGPGQGAAIEIRGVASFTNTNPLYVIDGMIADANPTINTNDIASIQILKDASAAAIYGSRAANGVIIITTKKGKKGPAEVNFNVKYGVQKIPNRWDVMNSTQFAAMQKKQYENSGLTPLASVDAEFDPSIDTDWQDEVLRLGNVQDYNLSLSGGSETGNYLISGSYFTNEGVLIGQSFDRASLRINTEVKKGRVTFGENLVMTNSIDRSPGQGNPFYDMPQMLPVIPVQDDKYINDNNPEGWGIGTTDAITYAWNPIAVNNLRSRVANFAKVVGNGYIDVKIADWMSYKFNAGLEASFDHIKNVRKLGNWGYSQAPAPSSINEDRGRFTSLLLEHTLNFNKTFGAHNINGVLGFSRQQFKREGISAGKTDLQVFNDRYYTTIGSATGTMTSGGGIGTDFITQGFLGRINYIYNDKYLLTITGRRDADSRFGENYRVGFFPSVAAGWRLTEEDFFNVNSVSNLKLYGSYGQLGIVTLGSWDYTAFLNNNPRAILGADQRAYVGGTQAQLANQDLRWEKRTSTNIGLDAGFLEDKFTLSAEYYNTLSEDVLVRLPVANYLGNLGGDPYVNAASIRNSGIEVVAAYKQREGEFKWDVAANFTTIKNKVEDVGNRGEGINYIQTGITRSEVGRSVGEWYLLKTDGLFQSTEEVNEHTNSEGTVIQQFAQPGDVRYIDVNDDGEINQDDRTYVGSPWPSLQTGAQFNASYKNFSLNLQLVGIFGYKVFNGVRQILDNYQNTNFRSDISPWTPDNRNTTDPRIGVSTGDPALVDNGRFESDRWLENASYVRLRNIELGYKLPESAISKLGVKNARVFISGQNLLTITKYTGLDPDVTGSGILERGFDQGNWPASRVFSVGLQCGF